MKLKHLAILMAALFVFGCAKADANKPMDQVKKEAETMNVKQLESQARAYVSAIEAKKSDLDQIQAKLKDIKPTELFSDKAKQIKNEISAISSEVSALTQRYNVYADKFRQLGGDVSKIKLS